VRLSGQVIEVIFTLLNSRHLQLQRQAVLCLHCLSLGIQEDAVNSGAYLQFFNNERIMAKLVGFVKLRLSEYNQEQQVFVVLSKSIELSELTTDNCDVSTLSLQTVVTVIEYASRLIQVKSAIADDLLRKVFLTIPVDLLGLMFKICLKYKLS
jgi:hypothetical protein